MGAEKWLDIELWDSPKECFKMLKSRGYRIATTHVGMDTVLLDSAIFVSSYLEKVCATNTYIFVYCIHL